MLTWQTEDGQGLEGTRLTLHAGGFRALGRMVRADFTASYRLIVGDDGTLERLSVTSAVAHRERHLTINRTEDGFWLLDTGSGGTRAEFGGAVDVDLAYSPMFRTLPIRRLGLHREAAEHMLPLVFVSLPELEVQQVEQAYRTVSVLPATDSATDSATVEFRRDEFASEVVVDAEGVVQHQSGLATRLTPAAATPAAAAS